MRFLYVFNKKKTPEWAACYFDYFTAKKLIGLGRKATSIQANIMDVTGQNSDHLVDQSDNNQNSLVSEGRRKQLYDQANQTIYVIVKQANQYFFSYHRFNKRIVFLFLQMKVHELQIRYKRYYQWNSLIQKDDDIYVSLLSYCYNESKLLDAMAEMNLQAFRKVIKKHKKVYSHFELPSPQPRIARVLRTVKKIQQQTNHLRSIYAQHKQLYPKQARIILGQQIQGDGLKSSLYFYFFGLSNGFSFSTLIATIILIGIYLSDKQLFLIQYRPWKFLGFIILYIWVFGFTFYFYEKHRLNYQLIFEFDNAKHQSTKMLTAASVFSLLYIGMFVFYVMNLANIYPVGFEVILVFPGIIFFLFILASVLRFIFFSTGASKFFIKTALSVFSSFLPCFPVTFGMIWATEQLLSLTQVVTDLVMSICYYANFHSYAEQIWGQCDSFIITAEIYALIIFMFRIIQIGRLLWKSRQLYNPEIHLLIRVLTNVLLCGLSLGYWSNPTGATLGFWIFFAVISLVYGVGVDLIIQWNLVVPERIQYDDEVNCFQKLIGRKFHIRHSQALSDLGNKVIIILTFIFRIAWIFTICPSILYSGQRAPKVQAIITVCSAVQLFRRGIWNMMRVQKQHMNNCSKFRVRMDYDQKQQIIYEKLKPVLQDKAEVNGSKSLEIRKKQEILGAQRSQNQVKNLKQCLQIKFRKQSQIQHWIQRQQKILQELQISVSNAVNRA